MRAMLAASVLLAAACWYRRSLADVAGFEIETGNDAGSNPDNATTYTEPTMLETLSAAAQTAVNTITGADAASMRTSPTGLVHLQEFERVALTPYRLGDGGSTIGWGRFYPDSGPPPPERISRETADEWFSQDVQERAEKWVKAYVTAPLTQPQFDALVSMAFNLSPRSFRTIATAVNEGQDPENAALQFVRSGTNLERGLRRRRASEVAIYRADPAYYG